MQDNPYEYRSRVHWRTRQPNGSGQIAQVSIINSVYSFSGKASDQDIIIAHDGMHSPVNKVFVQTSLSKQYGAAIALLPHCGQIFTGTHGANTADTMMAASVTRQ